MFQLLDSNHNFSKELESVIGSSSFRYYKDIFDYLISNKIKFDKNKIEKEQKRIVDLYQQDLTSFEANTTTEFSIQRLNTFKQSDHWQLCQFLKLPYTLCFAITDNKLHFIYAKFKLKKINQFTIALLDDEIIVSGNLPFGHVAETNEFDITIRKNEIKKIVNLKWFCDDEFIINSYDEFNYFNALHIKALMTTSNYKNIEKKYINLVTDNILYHEVGHNIIYEKCCSNPEYIIQKTIQLLP